MAPDYVVLAYNEQNCYLNSIPHVRHEHVPLTRAPLGYSAIRALLGGGADSAPPV